MFCVLDSWSSAPVAYSTIRPKSQIFNVGHDYSLWIRNFMVMMKKPENLDLETWSVGLGQKSSVISSKNTFLKRQLYFSQKLKNVLPISVAT
jgi:hypothetical protein